MREDRSVRLGDALIRREDTGGSVSSQKHLCGR